MESMFVEITCNANDHRHDIIIGVIYRPPGTNIHEFNDSLDNLMNVIKTSNKKCYIMGDFNIDILNSERHTGTSDFIYIIYSHSFLPCINRPTRITETTATLIDNIFTNNIHDLSIKSKNGILYTDISDHLPVFHLSHTVTPNKISVPVYKQVINDNTLSALKSKIELYNWQHIL